MLRHAYLDDSVICLESESAAGNQESSASDRSLPDTIPLVAKPEPVVKRENEAKFIPKPELDVKEPHTLKALLGAERIQAERDQQRREDLKRQNNLATRIKMSQQAVMKEQRRQKLQIFTDQVQRKRAAEIDQPMSAKLKLEAALLNAEQQQPAERQEPVTDPTQLNVEYDEDTELIPTETYTTYEPKKC